MQKIARGNYQLGLGLGLRNVHFDHIVQHHPAVDWFEAISENFMDSGGRPRAMLRKIAERYPLVLHGVSLSIGSSDPLNRNYLQRLKNLADEIQPRWVSDHLCWTGMLGLNSHDLLPLPLNEEVLKHLIPRVLQVQDFLQRPLVLENPSTYLRFRESTLSEPQFLRALCDATDCQLLLDVNNVYVSCFNAGTSAQAYLNEFPFERVVQLHLAGHQHCGTHIVDTHDGPVCNDVWQLFHTAWHKTGGAATLLEWDGDVPAFDVLHSEVLKARDWIHNNMVAQAPAPDSANISSGTNELLTTQSLSTPIGFMVPKVMTDSHLHQEA